MTDFTILSAPRAISLDCPHCEKHIEIDWNKLDPPGYWWDKWDDTECPHCGENIELGECQYD